MARASRVLPAPGGPIISMLCPPAAATSSGAFDMLLALDLAEIRQNGGGYRVGFNGRMGLNLTEPG